MNIEKTVDSLLSQAIHYHASDLHIIPRTKEYQIQFRIFGQLSPIRKIPFHLGERLISHLKFMALMDISEKRKPQSGSLKVHLNDQRISLRISTLPTVQSRESVAIRLLPHKQAISYNKLALFPKSTNLLRSLMVKAHGMILFTGPTGSGKSTTMYSLAEYSATHLKRHVVTLEDPVEKQNDFLLQIEVNKKAGVTFSEGLKAILRHDPDLIMIGEIRDAETAFIAIRAAMTGHLVLSSLHTRDPMGAIYRLLEFGVKQHEIEQTLIAITSQRLVSVICPYCGGSCSRFCHIHGDLNRVGIYEILHGKSLQNALKGKKRTGLQEQTLRQLIRKGIALGYLSNDEYSRWIIHEKEEDISQSSRAISYKNE